MLKFFAEIYLCGYSENVCFQSLATNQIFTLNWVVFAECSLIAKALSSH